ncbi:MAG: hypothetical protein ABI537_17215 [Casimicrobiaceae bacterium]
MYLDELFAQGGDHAFGIVGAGIRDADRTMHQALARQDFLYTVVEQEGDTTQARVITSMVGFVDPGDARADQRDGRPGDPHSFADDNRGWLLRRRIDRTLRPGARSDRHRCRRVRLARR